MSDRPTPAPATLANESRADDCPPGESSLEQQRHTPLRGLDGNAWSGLRLCLSVRLVADYSELLRAEELSSIENAAAARRNTFSTGRACAREALAMAGRDAAVLPRQCNGAVAWPEDLVGSITHTNKWAVAVVAESGGAGAAALGLDLEEIKTLEPGVLRLIATPTEQRQLQLPGTPAWLAIALFSLKESLYKCLQPRYGKFISFHDVEIVDLASCMAWHPQTAATATGNVEQNSTVAGSDLPGNHPDIGIHSPRITFRSESLAKSFNVKDLRFRVALLPGHVLTLAWLTTA